MKLSFNQSFAAWFALAIFMMFSVLAVLYFSLSRTADLDAWVVRTRDVIDTLNEISATTSNMESAGRSYVITGQTRSLEPYSVGKDQASQLSAALSTQVSDNPLQTKRAQQLRAKLLERIALSADMITLREQEGFDQARAFVITGRGTQVMGEVNMLVSEMKAEEKGLLILRTQKAAQERGLAMILGITGVLLSILIISLVFAHVHREGRRRMTLEVELSATNQHLASSLKRADRLIQEKQMIDHLDGLLHNCKTIEEAREIIGKELRRALPDMRGALYFFRASRNLVEAIADWNAPHALESSQSFAPDECWALKSGSRHVMRSPDDVACPHVDCHVTEAALCIPMNTHGQLIGVISVEGTQGQFDAARIDFIARLADQIGMSLATLQLQQQLRDQSLRDPLTGLFNRRYFEAMIEKEVRRTDRKRQTLGFVMIDIDYFKRTNDQYGHQIGDLILQGVSDTLSKNTRADDILCRYGGEEFLLVLADANLQVTQERAEVLREAVEKRVVMLSDGSTARRSTISLGVAIYPDDGRSWRDVLQAADQALYRAKAEGRNRVAVEAATPIKGVAAASNASA